MERETNVRTVLDSFQCCKQRCCAGRRECNGPPGLSNRFRRARSCSFMVYLALCRWERQKILGASWPSQTSVRTISTGVPLNWIKCRARFCRMHPGKRCTSVLSIRWRVNLSYPRRFRGITSRDHLVSERPLDSRWISETQHNSILHFMSLNIVLLF